MTTFKALETHYVRKLPINEIRLLLATASSRDVTYIHTHPEYTLKISEYVRFRWYAYRRTQGYSIAAIVGHKEFFGLNFFVSKHTLIPRPETELLVEEALQVLTNNTTLIDVGTGSGCIPIAILKSTSAKNVIAFATDTSSRALQIAKKNARIHGVPITFVKGNLLTPVPDTIFSKVPVILTANLPYLTQQQFDMEPSIQREPHSALVAENKGLALYEALLWQIQTHFTSNITALFEIDPSQTQPLLLLIKKILPQAHTKIKNDLAGRDRLVILAI